MSDVNLSLSESVVRPIIEAKVQAAVLMALRADEPSKLLEQLVEKALMLKVDSGGKVSNYSSENKYTLIETMANKAIQDAARSALTEWIDENKTLLQESFKRQLAKKPGAFAKAFIDGLIETSANSYRMSVTVEMKTTG